jgi:hypothetical protein
MLTNLGENMTTGANLRADIPPPRNFVTSIIRRTLDCTLVPFLEYLSFPKEVKGWFDITLPDFLQSTPCPFAFVHVDCDTYEATRTLIGLIGPKIVKGTVLVFDEYLGYRGWKEGEYKAWKEFVTSENLRYDYLGFAGAPVALIVTERP